MDLKWMRFVADAAGSIESLPSVACPDWADQAAGRLARLPGVLAVAAILARTSTDERLTPDAVGVCAGPTSLQGNPGSGLRLLEVRSRLENLAESGGLSIDALADGIPGLWGEQIEPATFTTRATIGDTGRTLVVQVSTLSENPDDLRRLSDALDALTPRLGRRAAIAFGGEQGAPGWLTNREQLVLEQLILGRSVREIAETTHRSPHTVHDHVKSLHRKLGASSRGALIAHALGRRSTEQTPRVMTTPCRPGGRAGVSTSGTLNGRLEPKPETRTLLVDGR